jgi:diguanylate cyclase (GGDEF)-like protein
MAQSEQSFRPLDRARLGRTLAWTMGVLFALHAVELLVFGHHRADLSRGLTAAVAGAAALSVFVRARFVAWSERTTWIWAGIGVLLWALAHAVETVIGHSGAASVLTVDASDFIYVSSLFPLLLAFSTTHETRTLRFVFALNCAQIALAMVLAYFMLYRMSLTPALAATVMGRIYGVACALLALMSVLRGLCWITQEERQTVRWISIFLWTYLPIELAMDYATQYKGLTAGTLLDLSWSVPFLLTGWKALTLTVDPSPEQTDRHRGKIRMLVESLCPLLMNAGIFALAAAVIRQHVVVGLSAIFLLIIIQGLQAALVQLNFMAGRNQLLDRESELRTANAALEALTLLDPLTGIANRRRFNATVETAWRRAIRGAQSLSILMVDIDFFKGVNDLHGHSYGDECLITLAKMLSQLGRRPDDLVARIGGEEFVLLLPDTDAEGAAAVASRLHESIYNLSIINYASPFDRRLTVSIGIASCMPAAGLEFFSIVDAADKALYAAKKQGRNCTCSALVQ